jgi:hypothetical protein
LLLGIWIEVFKKKSKLKKGFWKASLYKNFNFSLGKIFLQVRTKKQVVKKKEKA